jgi:hypothetical protein
MVLMQQVGVLVTVSIQRVGPEEQVCRQPVQDQGQVYLLPGDRLDMALQQQVVLTGTAYMLLEQDQGQV